MYADPHLFGIYQLSRAEGSRGRLGERPQDQAQVEQAIRDVQQHGGSGRRKLHRSGYKYQRGTIKIVNRSMQKVHAREM